MAYFLEQLINGLTLGAIYGLIAIGYTMVYGIIGMINFAHGEIYMIGAFISITCFIILGFAGITWVPLAIAIVLVVAMISQVSIPVRGALPALTSVRPLLPLQHAQGTRGSDHIR